MIATEIEEAVMSELLRTPQVEMCVLTGQKMHKDSMGLRLNSKFLTDFLLDDQLFTAVFEKQITWQNETVEECQLPVYYSKNLDRLEHSFNQEFKIHPLLSGHKKALIDIVFEKAASLIAEIPFIDASVEIVQSANFKFTLILHDQKILMISKLICEDDGSDQAKEIIFSLFINRELIASNVAQLDKFTEGFKKYLSM